MYYPARDEKDDTTSSANTPCSRECWALCKEIVGENCFDQTGIVNDAHLSAYRKGGLTVAGVFDDDSSKSKATAERFKIPTVYASLAEACAEPNAVFDVAVPPEKILDVLAEIAPRSSVLIQKPMGCDLADAKRIRQLCRDKDLCSAINFQLRFSPMMLAIRDALPRDLLGDVLNLEVLVSL